MTGTILIADDEREIRESLSAVLKDEGYTCLTVKDGSAAINAILENHIDLVITDIRMPGQNGLEVLAKTMEVSPSTMVVLITAFASVETAINALRLGATDYIQKPLDFDEVIFRVKRLLEHASLATENRMLKRQIKRDYDFNNMIGQSEAMMEIFRLIEKVGNTKANILITGSSGTGKELVARAIHSISDRAKKPFIPVNCGAIPENLFESELFGYVKGAFTGANTNQDGLFKAASEGTLFLDEIGELPENVQVKLLRAIQEKEIRPVGSELSLHIDVRIIAATNRNLKKEVEEGRFREDLFYRLNIIEMRVPDLKERREDIPLLANHFLNKYSCEFHRDVNEISRDTINLLMTHEWKGQVRELENAIERAVLLCDGKVINPVDLPMLNGSSDNIKPVPSIDTDNLNDTLQAYEKMHIEAVLRRTKGNRSETARLLGIDPSTLYRKMEKLDIT